MRLRLALTALLLAIAHAALAAPPVTRNLQFLANKDDYAAFGYSACWSYVHGDGREYAIIGTGNGTAIYNVTNPATTYQVGFIAGPTSLWREMKSYRNWLYIVTEGGGTGQGLQIVRMTNPEAPVLAATYTGSFIRSHTVSVDTSRAILICNGTRNASGLATGLRVLSLANPEAPVEIGVWPPGGAVPVSSSDYVHDSVPIGNLLYASSINSGIQRVLDFTNPAAPTQWVSWTYGGAFTHNAWPDATGKWLYVTDEVNGEPLKIFDITTVTSPTLANTISANPQAIVHNAHVNGTDLWLSNYTEGIRALDLSDPAHPAEWAYADSYAGASGGFFGVWEVCPYFPSGTVIASDMQSGLYVYRPQRDYGLVRVHVSLEGTAAARAAGASCGGAEPGFATGVLHAGCSAGGCGCGADCTCEGHEAALAAGQDFRVRLLSQGDSLRTPADGIVVFAPSPGSEAVEVSKFGYYTQVVPVDVVDGESDTLHVVMVAKPAADFTGIVRDAVSTATLFDAEVVLPQWGLHDHTTAGGGFDLPQIPDDDYVVNVARPGYAPFTYQRRIGPGFDSEDFSLQPAVTWHDFEAANGWTIGFSGDNATTGQWERVEPLGTGARFPGDGLRSAGALGAIPRGPAERNHEGHEEDGAVPGDVQPEFDRSPEGTICWVTGQGATPGSIGEADIDGGRTSLVSPYFSTAGMADPTFGAWTWFYTTDVGAADYLRVYLNASGSGTWVLAYEHRGTRNHWTEIAIPVNQFLPAATSFRVRFTASDSAAGTVTEAAIDDAVVYDRALPVTHVAESPRLMLRAPWPNPGSGAVRLSVVLGRDGELEAEVLDLQGRVVRTLAHEFATAGEREIGWDGRDTVGRSAPPGLYLVRVRGGGELRTARVVRVE